MGYKGTKDKKKRHLKAISPRLHSLKMLPVCCGNILSDVVTALTHCKTVRSFDPPCLDVVKVCISCASGPLENTKQVHHFLQSASLWLCDHPFLFIRVQKASDVCWIEAEAAADDRMPSTMRHFVSYLLGAMTVFCPGFGLGSYLAIFRSGFKTLCSLSYPVWCIYMCI